MKTIVGKVVLLGSQGVGKTALITRYIENSFHRQIAATVGALFFTCKVVIDDNIVTLQIWDTSGQERFKAMAPMFYRNANAALLIFDIASQISFDSIKMWVQELKGNVDEPMMLCMVGNKIDLNDQREVSREEALAYSKSIGATYLECSAMTDQGVSLIFEKLAQGLLRLQGLTSTLKVYDDDIMAISSDLEATDTANEENVNVSIRSIAHGNTVNFGKCC